MKTQLDPKIAAGILVAVLVMGGIVYLLFSSKRPAPVTEQQVEATRAAAEKEIQQNAKK